MGRFFGFVMLVAIVGTGGYIYMRQAQSVTIAGAASPEGTIDIVAVQRDLMAIARAERAHNAMSGSYASLDDLRSAGDLSLESNSRGPFTYSVDVSANGFHAVATYSGPSNLLARKTISIDQDMEFSEQ